MADKVYIAQMCITSDPDSEWELVGAATSLRKVKRMITSRVNEEHQGDVLSFSGWVESDEEVFCRFVMKADYVNPEWVLGYRILQTEEDGSV